LVVPQFRQSLLDRLAFGDIRQVGGGDLILCGDPVGDFFGRAKIGLQPAIRICDLGAVQGIDLIDPTRQWVGDSGVLGDRRSDRHGDPCPYQPQDQAAERHGICLHVSVPNLAQGRPRRPDRSGRLASRVAPAGQIPGSPSYQTPHLGSLALPVAGRGWTQTAISASVCVDLDRRCSGVDSQAGVAKRNRLLLASIKSRIPCGKSSKTLLRGWFGRYRKRVDICAVQWESIMRFWKIWLSAFCLLFACGLPTMADTPDASSTRKEDVIYGRKFGTALTMDVFTPRQGANGAAVVFVVSGGWVSAHESIGAPFFKDFIPELIRRGYTVFAVVHGSQPRYTIPEVLDDMHRAVRFIRYNAKEYHIDPERLGITGGSAGGHLSLMQGMAGKDGDAKARDPVNRVSSHVQAVGCFFPPTDFLNYGQPGEVALGTGVLKGFKAPFDFNELDKKTNSFVLITDE